MTILELMVVIVIIAIIATMLLPAYSAWNARSEEARCLANLRNLYVAGAGYLNATGEWPQVPVKWIIDEPKQYAKAWVEVLKPFGAPHATWICPSMQRNLGTSLEAVDTDENYRIDFMATPFSDQPDAPRLAGHHPWFMEKAASHARGQLFIFADGSTAALLDFMSTP